MSRSITVDLDLANYDIDTNDDVEQVLADEVGEFASGVGAEVDVTLIELSFGIGAAVVEVSGADEDVALFSRRWFEE